jgi:hypothetical protein
MDQVHGQGAIEGAQQLDPEASPAALAALGAVAADVEDVLPGS